MKENRRLLNVNRKRMLGVRSVNAKMPKRDYKRSYENLSARISALHAFADLISGPDMGFGTDKLNRQETSRTLKKIAFGQLGAEDLKRQVSL